MEGVDERVSSEAPSSSDDFYNSEEVRPAKDTMNGPAKDTMHDPPPDMDGATNGDDDNDSSSEMDLSTPSRTATPEPEPLPASAASSTLAGSKRKLSDSDSADDAASLLAAERFKKRKLFMTRALEQSVAPPTAGLPVEIWQRVFSQYLSPTMLARCLRVCKSFHQYLTAIPAQPPVAKKNQGKVQPVDSESIWTQSRKNYFTTLPRPLNGLSELQMLQLIGGRRCQFCDRQPVRTPATSFFTAGPGPDGVRVIWPFRIRSCGQCLEYRMLKDVQVLAYPEYAPLRAGVTHGFRSTDLHFATESQRQTPQGIPANLRFSKIYYKAELDAIKDEAELAKTLGDGAADEWRKGLVAKGKEAMADCARWEKWELNMRPGTDLAQVLREYDLSSFPHLVEETQSRSAGVNGTQPHLTANGTTHPLPQPVHVFGNTAALQQGPVQHYPQHQFPQQHLPFAHPLPQHFHHQPQQHIPRAGRSLQEAEQARQSRKADIERRCRELEPPLEPNVLQHIDSFQAAMQIALPMTDDAWEILKPKLLEKREAAEWVEHERASQLAVLQAAMPLNPADEIIPKPAKETYDREYEQAQEPLRKTLGEYADDFINGRWNAGKIVDKNNAPIFAIHVLLHVYQRYTEDKQLGLLPRFEPPKRKETGKQSTPPLEPFLSLDNMKWVYDNKVRPLTDVHKRELFLCPGCTKERNPKWFAFEGLIQHYGAKHTTAFSKGNIVVHWQTAQWPEEAPFHTNPSQWLTVDRRSSDYKPHGKARHTPQANRESPFTAPNPAPQLPDNPYHAASNGYAASGHGHHGSFASPTSHTGQNGYFYSHPAQVPPQPAADTSHDVQITKLSNDAREIWDALDGVKGLLESIRVQTVIHHAVLRFLSHFNQQPPSLDLLTDALATNNMMRPLKNAHGLACKSCVAAQPNGTGNNPSYWIRIQGVKKYNTSSLITHFKLMHQPSYQAGYPDWSKDLIELPEGHVVNELLRTPGMDDDKLPLIAAAFPKAFPNPLPKIGLVTEDVAEVANDDNPAKSLIERLARKPQTSQKKKKGGQASNGVAERTTSQEPLPEPREDEYDPRRPMFVQPKSQAPDPSQFDTDVGKQSAPPAPPAGFNFTPETLAALQGIQQHQPEPARHRQSRSPSVGRPSDVAAAPSGAPDISAILAALTGQAPAQAESAPTSSTHRTANPSHQPYAEPPSRSHYDNSAAYQSESRRSSGRHENAHQASNDPLAALQAALSQNSRQFDQNQHNTYVEARPEPTPRYQYVYEGDRHYAQPPAHTPTYREPPVQYVQVPEREYASYPHHYERAAAPKPIYVDQYGRPLELVPVDAAPAPVQYASNPYEQQQQQYGRRHEPAVYTSHPPGAHLQPIYDDRRDDRRPVYYEPVPHAGTGARYAYDDARASVPRS